MKRLCPICFSLSGSTLYFVLRTLYFDVPGTELKEQVQSTKHKVLPDKLKHIGHKLSALTFI
jgi:hypothetical protein